MKINYAWEIALGELNKNAYPVFIIANKFM